MKGDGIGDFVVGVMCGGVGGGCVYGVIFFGVRVSCLVMIRVERLSEGRMVVRVVVMFFRCGVSRIIDVR